MIVNIEDIRKISELMKKINSVPLDEIVIHENGKPVAVNEEAKYLWEHTGLSNFTYLKDEIFSGKIEVKIKG